MVKTSSRHPFHRRPIEKLEQGNIFSDAMNEKFVNSGEESREELNFSFQSSNNNIRRHFDESVPQWDMRAAPPGSVDNEVHLGIEQNASTNQHRYQNFHPSEVNNQWINYSAQSGFSQKNRDAKSQNIWSQKQLLPKASDLSFHSSSAGPSIGAFSADTRNSQFQTSKAESYDSSIRDISESISQFHLKGTGDDAKTAIASISSNNTYGSNVIPGVVAASSGSTGGTGETSLTGQRYQQIYSHGRRNAQSTMNSNAQIYYPKAHSLQQQP